MHWQERQSTSRRFVDENKSARQERKVVQAHTLYLVYSQSLLISEIHLSHRSTSTPPNPSPPSPSTVKYWLSDNGPLVECIYYASVVDNPPKWASKRWLVDVFSNFSSSPSPPHHLHRRQPPPISVPQTPLVFQINNIGQVAHAQVKRWGQDGGDKDQLLMNREIWWFQSISPHIIIYCWAWSVWATWCYMM